MLCVNETALNATGDARYYKKTEIDTQGEMEAIWSVTLATDSEVTSAIATKDECSEITGCVENAITNASRNTSSTDVEGTDFGTLSDTKWCVYDLAGTEIDCDVEPVVDTDDQTCAEVSGCVENAITAAQDQNNYTSGVSVTGTSTKSINVAIVGRSAINATFTDIDTDTNNYTTSISFNLTGSIAQLNLARSGITANLTALLTMNDTTRAYPGTCTGQSALQAISATAAATCVGFGISNSTLLWIANGTGLTGGNITTGGSLSLAVSGVTAGRYGNATAVPICDIDTYGRITSCTNTSITFPTDQNNYTSGVGFVGNTLQIAMIGRSNVTASLTSLGAGNITPGTFGAGDYVFPANVNVTGNISATYNYVTCTVYPSGFKVGDCG